MAIVRNLMVRAGADFSGLQRGMQQATRQLEGFHRSLEGTVKKIGVTLAGIGVGFGIKEAIDDAMKVEAALQQVNRQMGDSAGEFTKWANDSASAFGMSKAQAIEYGAVYGNLIRGFSNGTEQTFQRTQELLKASAVIASATGRSMDDVMERIRSGLLGNTEAIEDLGVNVNVAMIQSTNAFKQFAGNKSWQQLDFQTQQQIRLAAILEQTYSKYGDSLNQNTSTSMAMFVAQLNNIKLSLGQAFLPVLNVVLPVLTTFANKLASVMGIVAQFSQALFGKGVSVKQQVAQAKATAQQATAVTGLGNALKKTGNAAKTAGDKAKGSLAGFDEVNQLADSSSSGSKDSSAAGGAGAGGGVSVPTTPVDLSTNAPEITKKIQDMANKVKQIIKDLSSFMNKHKDIIISAISGIVAGFGAFVIISKWDKIVKGLTIAWEALSAAITGISWPIVAVAALIALLVANLVYLWRTNEKFRDSVLDIWNQIKSLVTKVASDMWSILKNLWDKYGADIVKGVGGFMKSIQDIILNLWNNFLKPTFQNGLKMLTDLWNTHLKGMVQQALDFLAKLITFALGIWNYVISPIVNYLIKNLGPAFSQAFGLAINIVGTMLSAVSDVAKGLFRALGGIIDFITGVFTGNWKKAWGGVKDIFGGIFSGLYALIKLPLNLIIDGVNSLISGLNKIDIKVPSWVPGLGGKNFGFSIPKIPHLANGGIVNSPTMALIGEGGESEAVTPLSKLNDIVASAVGTAVMQAMQYNNPSNKGGDTVNLSIDGRVFARLVKPYLDNENKRVGKIVKLNPI
jgi:phage-related protein